MLLNLNFLSTYESFRNSPKIFQVAKLPLKVGKFTNVFNDVYKTYRGIDKKDTIFYIGVPKDDYLYLLTKFVGPAGKLVIFTPTFNSYDRLVSLTERMRWRNVSVVLLTFYFLSNGIKFSPESIIRDMLQRATLVNPADKKHGDETDIFCDESLDQFYSSSNVYPRFLEIKMPWYELVVLQGAKEIIKKYRPTVIFEGDERFSSRKNILSVFKYLTNLGYEGFFMLDDALMPLKKFSFDVHQNEESGLYCKTFVFKSAE